MFSHLVQCTIFSVYHSPPFVNHAVGLWDDELLCVGRMDSIKNCTTSRASRYSSDCVSFRIVFFVGFCTQWRQWDKKGNERVPGLRGLPCTHHGSQTPLWWIRATWSSFSDAARPSWRPNATISPKCKTHRKNALKTLSNPPNANRSLFGSFFLLSTDETKGFTTTWLFSQSSNDFSSKFHLQVDTIFDPKSNDSPY